MVGKRHRIEGELRSELSRIFRIRGEEEGPQAPPVVNATERQEKAAS